MVAQKSLCAWLAVLRHDMVRLVPVGGLNGRRSPRLPVSDSASRVSPMSMTTSRRRICTAIGPLVDPAQLLLCFIRHKRDHDKKYPAHHSLRIQPIAHSSPPPPQLSTSISSDVQGNAWLASKVGFFRHFQTLLSLQTFKAQSRFFSPSSHINVGTNGARRWSIAPIL